MMYINCCNLIKIVAAIFEKIAVLGFGAQRAHVFGAGMFRFMGCRPRMDKLLKAEYE
jgi:hypothetical protein